MNPFKGILIALLAAFGAFLLSATVLPDPQAKLIGAVLFLVILWTNEALPLGVVSLLPIALFPALGIMETNPVSGNYAKSIIFLFLGGFMLAIATEKTGLHKVIARSILGRFSNTPRGILMALAVTSAFLSSLLSNTTTTLLLLPIALYLADDLALKARFVLAVAFAASIGGIMTPIGTPPNLILLGFMESAGYGKIPFMSWILLTAPLALVMLMLMAWLLSLGISHLKIHQELTSDTAMTPSQRRLLWVLASLALLLLLNSPIPPYYPGLGLNEKGLILGYGLLMFLPKVGFLTWKDNKQIPYEIIFLFGAGFSIAAGFEATGLDTTLATHLLALTDWPLLFLLLALAALTTFATGVTSNTALIAMLLPVIDSMARQGGMDPHLVLLTATVASSFAFMLPISTPPNAIALSSGALHIATMVRFGTLLNLIGILLLTLTARFYWPVFLELLR